MVQSSTGGELDSVVDELVTANRVLADLGIVDGFGHVSARTPGSHDRFVISRSRAPALVERGDMMILDLDGSPVRGDERRPYLERHIHGEIYRLRPDVAAVVHSHAPTVLPFTITTAPLRPAFHLAAFLGSGPPVFDIADRFGATDMLVRTAAHGAALAEALGPAAAVLMRGHGYVTVGASVPHAVARAVYTAINATVLTQAMGLGGDPRTLDTAEAELAEGPNREVVPRAWELWAAQVAAGMPIETERGAAWTSPP